MPEEISCDPNDLAQSAKCFCFGDQRQIDSIIIYLLAQIAENTDSPSVLAKNAACYCFSDTKSREAVMLYLLCAIADAAGA